MKKYSKLTILVLVIIITLSTFYLQMGNVTSSFAQYEIKTVEGDESMIENVVVKGDYYASYVNYEQFKLTKDGTHYLRDEPFLKRLDGYYVSDQVAQLQNGNRKFMRMKNSEVNTYFETDDLIISAEIPYTRWGTFKGHLELETYNRQTNEQNTYEIEAPDLLDYAMVEKMYMNEDKLYIPVINMEYDIDTDEEVTRLSVFVFDFTEKTLVDSFDVTLSDANYYSDFTEIFVNDENNPTEMVITGVFIDYEELEETTEDEGTPDENEEFREYVELTVIKKIDLQTNEVSDIEITDGIKNGVPIAFNGTEIIFANAEGNNLVYSTFNIETGEMAEKLKVETNVEFVSMWDFEGNIIDDRKVYTLINNEYESSATLVVIDIDTNELLYQGTIEGDSQRRISKDESQVYFHTLEVNDL